MYILFIKSFAGEGGTAGKFLYACLCGRIQSLQIKNKHKIFGENILNS